MVDVDLAISYYLSVEISSRLVGIFLYFYSLDQDHFYTSKKRDTIILHVCTSMNLNVVRGRLRKVAKYEENYSIHSTIFLGGI
jgi:hypothetical protein